MKWNLANARLVWGFYLFRISFDFLLKRIIRNPTWIAINKIAHPISFVVVVETEIPFGAITTIIKGTNINKGIISKILAHALYFNRPVPKW